MNITDPAKIHAAWDPAQTHQAPNTSDTPMLDIDWSEWDKLFPLEMNNGDLDLPMQLHAKH